MNYADAVTKFIRITGKEKLLLNNELYSLFMGAIYSAGNEERRG